VVWYVGISVSEGTYVVTVSGIYLSIYDVITWIFDCENFIAN